jgi:phosphoglycolate phosphatase
MPTVAATYGYLGEKADVSTWGADLSVDSPNKLLQLLAEA